MSEKEDKDILAKKLYEHPTPFLEVRVHDRNLSPGKSGACVGYENEKWRDEQFVNHLMEWLPEFALIYNECVNMNSSNALALLVKAAKSVYQTEKHSRRGELGELILHVLIRQVFHSFPAVSKIYFKDSRNDTVKGFDAVHVVVDKDDLQLWLGEVKFYDSISDAINHVITELQAHTERDYLRDEFVAITNKIDDTMPHAEKLKKLLDRNVSLDEIFKKICIPVLLTYDSETIKKYKVTDANYINDFTTEVNKHYKTFSEKKLPENLTIHLFLLPLEDKKKLQSIFDDLLKKWQTMTN